MLRELACEMGAALWDGEPACTIVLCAAVLMVHHEATCRDPVQAEAEKQRRSNARLWTSVVQTCNKARLPLEEWRKVQAAKELRLVELEEQVKALEGQQVRQTRCTTQPLAPPSQPASCTTPAQRACASPAVHPHQRCDHPAAVRSVAISIALLQRACLLYLVLLYK